MNTLRKRELLLSLKHGTIESCFSVPMLTLTMGNMPFLIGFAVKSLGWSDRAVGMLAAMPFFCLFIQPPITLLLQRRLSLLCVVLSPSMKYDSSGTFQASPDSGELTPSAT